MTPTPGRLVIHVGQRGREEEADAEEEDEEEVVKFSAPMIRRGSRIVLEMEFNGSSGSSSSSFSSPSLDQHEDLEHRVLHLSNGAIITLIVMVILTFVSLLGLLGLYFLCPRRRTLNLGRNAGFTHIHIHAAAAARPKAGLEPDEINRLPLLTLQDLASLSKSSKTCGNGCCAVCLAEFSDQELPGDEKIRFLPQCRHCFHPQCVDVWLQTSASCPLCRCDVHRNQDDDEEQSDQVGRGGEEGAAPHGGRSFS